MIVKTIIVFIIGVGCWIISYGLADIARQSGITQQLYPDTPLNYGDMLVGLSWISLVAGAIALAYSMINMLSKLKR